MNVRLRTDFFMSVDRAAALGAYFAGFVASAVTLVCVFSVSAPPNEGADVENRTGAFEQC